MNEPEANKKAQEMISARSRIFCPIIKAICNTSCECYKMPEVYETSEPYPFNGFKVRHGFCTCYALKGASD